MSPGRSTFAALHEAGDPIFGSRLQCHLARALNVSERAVQRWVVGESDPPADCNQRLRALIDARIVALAALRLKLLP